ANDNVLTLIERCYFVPLSKRVISARIRCFHIDFIVKRVFTILSLGLGETINYAAPNAFEGRCNAGHNFGNYQILVAAAERQSRSEDKKTGKEGINTRHLQHVLLPGD